MVEVGQWGLKTWEHFPTGARGALTAVNSVATLPFEVRRLFWLTGLQPGMQRGGHAHKGQSQLFVVITGSARFSLYDQQGRHEVVLLAAPNMALVTGPLVWCTMLEFAPGTAILALADGPHEPDDYLRTEEAFRAYQPEPTRAQTGPPVKLSVPLVNAETLE